MSRHIDKEWLYMKHEANVRELLKDISFHEVDKTRKRNWDTGELADTPKRFIKMLLESTEAQDVNMTDFKAPTNPVEVTVENITYSSLCEHHLAPFHGVAKVKYLPKDRIIGISKIPRLVKAKAKNFQNQERITEEIAQTLFDTLNPEYVTVEMEGVHTCMVCRGVEEANAKTITKTHLPNKRGGRIDG